VPLCIYDHFTLLSHYCFFFKPPCLLTALHRIRATLSGGLPCADPVRLDVAFALSETSTRLLPQLRSRVPYIARACGAVWTDKRSYITLVTAFERVTSSLLTSSSELIDYTLLREHCSTAVSSSTFQSLRG
jgi:hypothetical protein